MPKRRAPTQRVTENSLVIPLYVMHMAPSRVLGKVRIPATALDASVARVLAANKPAPPPLDLTSLRTQLRLDRERLAALAPSPVEAGLRKQRRALLRERAVLRRQRAALLAAVNSSKAPRPRRQPQAPPIGPDAAPPGNNAAPTGNQVDPENAKKLAEVSAALADRDAKLAQLAAAFSDRESKLSSVSKDVADRDAKLAQITEAARKDIEARDAKFAAVLQEAGKTLAERAPSPAPDAFWRDIDRLVRVMYQAAGKLAQHESAIRAAGEAGNGPATLAAIQRLNDEAPRFSFRPEEPSTPNSTAYSTNFPSPTLTPSTIRPITDQQPFSNAPTEQQQPNGFPNLPGEQPQPAPFQNQSGGQIQTALDFGPPPTERLLPNYDSRNVISPLHVRLDLGTGSAPPPILPGLNNEGVVVAPSLPLRSSGIAQATVPVIVPIATEEASVSLQPVTNPEQTTETVTTITSLGPQEVKTMTKPTSIPPTMSMNTSSPPPTTSTETSGPSIQTTETSSPPPTMPAETSGPSMQTSETSISPSDKTGSVGFFYVLSQDKDAFLQKAIMLAKRGSVSSSKVRSLLSGLGIDVPSDLPNNEPVIGNAPPMPELATRSWKEILGKVELQMGLSCTLESVASPSLATNRKALADAVDAADNTERLLRLKALALYLALCNIRKGMEPALSKILMRIDTRLNVK